LHPFIYPINYRYSSIYLSSISLINLSIYLSIFSSVLELVDKASNGDTEGIKDMLETIYAESQQSEIDAIMIMIISIVIIINNIMIILMIIIIIVVIMLMIIIIVIILLMMIMIINNIIYLSIAIIQVQRFHLHYCINYLFDQNYPILLIIFVIFVLADNPTKPRANVEVRNDSGQSLLSIAAQVTAMIIIVCLSNNDDHS